MKHARTMKANSYLLLLFIFSDLRGSIVWCIDIHLSGLSLGFKPKGHVYWLDSMYKQLVRARQPFL
jgi:hypothetical protein